jgi:hypothetical protein
VTRQTILALRVQKLMADLAAAKARLLAGAEKFKAELGYTPPYWMLVWIARGATKNPASVAAQK